MPKIIKTILIIIAVMFVLGIATIVVGGAFIWYRIIPSETKLLYKGYKLVNRGKYDEAIAIFDEILKKNPNDISALYGRAEVFKIQKKYDEAVAIYDHVLKKYPEYESALTRKADIFVIQGKYEEAIMVYERVLENNPKSCSAWNRKGEVFLKLERNKEAIESFDEGLKYVDEMG